MDWIRDTAIRNLYSTVVTVRENGTKAFAEDGNPVVIDENQVSAEMARLQAEYDAQQYIRDRIAEYPDYREYLDAIVKGDEAQKQKYIDDCLAVKAKYPKNLG